MSEVPVTTDDLSLYAMHLLGPEDSRRMETILQTSSEAREELRQILGDLAWLSLSVEPQALPDAARASFLNRIAQEPKLVADTQPATLSTNGLHTSAKVVATAATSSAPRLGKIYDDDVQPGFLARLLPWAGWAVAGGLALSTWTFYQRSMDLQGSVSEAQNKAQHAVEVSDKAVADSARARNVLEALGSPSAQRFLLTRQNTAPSPSARVTYVAATGSLVFQGNNLEEVPSEKAYELWLIPADKGAKPIPAGTFKPDPRGYASLILPSLPKGVTAATFGITMEDAAGATSPTLPILLIGA
ncbi:MAG: anti-sigma factor domain-containing protein [Janthinobacterium lividum]